jgi:plasmid stabilization system protein ParE
MRVRFTPEAFSDRERIPEYLKERSESGWRGVAASIREAIVQLGNQPHSGYPTDNPDVRVLFVVRVRDDVVEILHLRHTSRRAWTGER